MDSSDITRVQLDWIMTCMADDTEEILGCVSMVS